MSFKFLPVAILTIAGVVAPVLHAETVTCSFYGNKYNGRRTASGHRFNNNDLTAASKTLPMGTRLKLTNPKNHRSVIVRVNDRGPFTAGRDLSITRHAAARLGIVHAGVAQLDMETLSTPEGHHAKK